MTVAILPPFCVWLCQPTTPHSTLIAKKWTCFVPVGEVIGELDDLCDGFGVPLGDAAHIQLAVALFLHFGNHPLESGAPPNGEEDLGGDPIGDALQALFDKCFSLPRKGVGGKASVQADKRGQGIQCVELKGPLGTVSWPSAYPCNEKIVCCGRDKKCPYSLRLP